jgi:hypothetical protein
MRTAASHSLAIITLALTAWAWAQNETMVAMAFSALAPGAPPAEGWRVIGASRDKPPTRYTLVHDGGVTVLRADSSNAVSGLSRALRVNPAEYPLLKWRWKISNVLKNSDLTTKEGDDFPARVYVMFDYPLEKLPFGERTKLRLARALYDPHLPAATLCYVWDGRAAAGTIVPSPYTDRVRTLVVESGAARVNRWLDVERNVAADFRAAFGEEAPAVSGVAVATDTDNTGESATAFFGDIFFQKQPLK